MAPIKRVPQDSLSRKHLKLLHKKDSSRQATGSVEVLYLAMACLQISTEVQEQLCQSPVVVVVQSKILVELGIKILCVQDRENL